MARQFGSLTKCYRNHRDMWLLRWTEGSGAYPRVKQSHDFWDEHEARTVLASMRSGLTFEQALRELLRATGCEGSAL